MVTGKNPGKETEMMIEKIAASCTTIMRRILIMILCLVLPAGASHAAGTVELCCGNMDTYLDYEFLLPDGRAVLSGIIDGNEKQMRLVCLNTDGTVSWEYVSDDHAEYWCPYAALRRDGTIAVASRRFSRQADDIVVKFLTPDGQQAAEDMVIPTGGGSLWPDSISRSGVTLERQVEVPGKDEPESQMEVYDWDGNLVSGYPYRYEEETGEYFREMEEQDGLLLFGTDNRQGGHAKIVKKENREGKPIWETTVTFEWPDADWSTAISPIPTDDEGHIIQVLEMKNDPEEDRHRIVKLDNQGSIRWSVREDTEKGEHFGDMTVFNGKTAVHLEGDEVYEKLEIPRTFRWFDPEGNDLGTTVLELKTEDFPGIQKYLEEHKDSGREMTPRFMGMEYVPLGEELYALVFASVEDCKDWPDSTVDTDWPGGYDTVLIKIPTL